MYLDLTQVAAAESGDEARNVAAGNAVLAGIAASDAICCVRLNKRHRGQDHQGAVALLGLIRPHGPMLAAAWPQFSPQRTPHTTVKRLLAKRN